MQKQKSVNGKIICETRGTKSIFKKRDIMFISKLVFIWMGRAAIKDKNDTINKSCKNFFLQNFFP